MGRPPAGGDVMSPASSRLSLAFSCVGHTYSHLFMLLYPTVVLALGDVFGMPFGELLTLALPGFIAFGACALPAGWLGERWSLVGMMAVFFFGTGAASILTGLARDPFEIAAGLTLIGVFAAIYHPVGIAWVVRIAAKRGKALGINGLFGNWGVAAGAIVAGTLTELISWRAAFIVPGAICVLTGAAFLLFARSGHVASTTTDRVTNPPVTRGEMRRVLAVVAAAALFGGIVFQSTAVGLPKVFDQRLGGLVSGTLGVGGLVALVYFVAGFSQIAVGHLIDRFPLKPIYIAIYLLQAPLLLAAATLYGAPLLIVAAGFVFFIVGVLPVGDSLVARYTPLEWRSIVYGAKFVIALGVSALGVPLVALIHDATGDFTWLFIVLSALSALVVVAGLFLPAERRAPVQPILDQAD